MRRITIIASFVLINAAAVFAQIATGTGMISGTVTDESGTPTNAATVLYHKQPEFVREATGRLLSETPGVSGTAISDSNGTFAISGLPAGRYHVCVRGSADTVGDCEWDGSAVIDLSKSQAVFGLKKTLRYGCTLRIHVADPNRRIDIPDSMGKILPERRFFVGAVSDKSFYRRAELVSRSDNEIVYAVIVPSQSSFRLFVDTDAIVVDASERTIPVKRPTDFKFVVSDSKQHRLDLFVK
jgi:hypothetical protein